MMSLLPAQAFKLGWPQSFQELLPPCWGHPQDCRDKNMPGDTKKAPQPSPLQQAMLKITSICVTPYQGGVAAWFPYQPPPNYGKMEPFSLTNLKQCSNYQINDPVYQGSTMTVAPTGWSVTTYPNGSKIYMMNGRIQ
jgi:hypothetical protein